MHSQHLAVNHQGPVIKDKPHHPILDLPLGSVIKSDYALPLQHILKLYTVGCLLGAWRSPRNQKSIEDVFDSPEQAHHVIATCAAWLGYHIVAAPGPVPAWWQNEEIIPAAYFHE